MTIYLYKKTHNKTGLQYLGKTKQDPLKYRGSGTDWAPHIKEHGYDVTTEILKECLTKEELSYWGRYYSKLWNVVDDPNWANRIPETGGGGDLSGASRVGIPRTEETKQKLRDSLTGRKQPAEQIEKRRIANRKPRPSMQGRKCDPIHIAARKKSLTGKKKSNTDKMKGPKTETHSKNISLGKRGKKLAVDTCPHCNKTGGRGNMMRYHFDFCKSVVTTQV